MKHKVNNILVGLLWLLAVTLVASFWFNIKYGFNLFVGQHWQYLAYMQASNQPIKTSFYLSLVLFIAMMILGLYVLIQPHHRKIVLPVFDHTQTQEKQPAQKTPGTDTQKSEQPTKQTQNSSVLSTDIQPALARPPRLNISQVSRATAPHSSAVSANPVVKPDPEHDFTEIHDIFTNAGYVVKGAPRIKNIQTSVIAIGTDEELWVGATDVTTQDMQKTIDTLQNVFLDTLEDIEIHINAFIINAPDKNDSNILNFANIDELRAYINEHPNTPPAEDDVENFDAYSAYIGTVIDYIRKI